MVLSFVKDQICFDDDKKKKKFFYVTEKIRSISIFEKRHFFYEEDLIHKIISCYMTQTKQTTIHDLFLYFKNLHALKNQICI